MRPLLCAVLALATLAGCKREDAAQSTPSKPDGGLAVPTASGSLAEARRGFKSKLVPQVSEKTPVAAPPAHLFRVVKYTSALGELPAYLSVAPKDGKKHPAIVWVTGGDCNTIDEGCWKEGQGGNDQSASAYRKAGIVMMFPSQRGGNNNPGPKESFLGEIDDVLAAAEFLAKQDFVDPNRIYLGGHSTGGTTALLASECSDRFRAVFSFGPVENIAGYGREFMPFNTSDSRETQLRSPGPWLAGIKRPTFVIEGTVDGNIDSLRAMARVNTNPAVHFVEARGGDHFTILAPLNRLLAQKVLADTGPTCNITLAAEDVSKALGR